MGLKKNLVNGNRFEKMSLLLKQKGKRLDKVGINSLEKVDAMVVVMDHQKCLTAAGMHTKCVSAFLPFNRGTSSNYAKNTCLFPLSCSIAITNDHIVINQLRKLSNI